MRALFEVFAFFSFAICLRGQNISHGQVQSDCGQVKNFECFNATVYHPCFSSPATCLGKTLEKSISCRGRLGIQLTWEQL